MAAAEREDPEKRREAEQAMAAQMARKAKEPAPNPFFFEGDTLRHRDNHVIGVMVDGKLVSPKRAEEMRRDAADEAMVAEA